MGEMITAKLYKQLTPHERRSLRNAYVEAQNGLCYWCNCPLNEKPPNGITSKKIDWRRFPQKILKYPIHLQHDHDSGLTEGAVHSYCNAVMWQYHAR